MALILMLPPSPEPIVVAAISEPSRINSLFVETFMLPAAPSVKELELIPLANLGSLGIPTI